MTGSEATVTFYFGLGSRYSYLAATQIASLESRTGAKVDWRPILSSVLTGSHDQAPFRWDEETKDWWGARVSGQYREAYRQLDMARWATFYGVPYQEPKAPLMDARRRTLFCVAAALSGEGPRYAKRMFNSIYVEGVAVDEAHCRDLATEVSLKPDDLASLIESGEAGRTHDDWVTQAQDADVFGVPTFVHGDTAFWGNDRLVLLEAALTR